jgi:hypothetical protein
VLRALDSLKISSYELMQASTYMYCVRLQVETCNVQRGRLPRMTNDKWQMTNRNHLMGLTPGPRSFEVRVFQSARKHWQTPLGATFTPSSQVPKTTAADKQVRHSLGLPSRANQFNSPRPVIPAAFPSLRKAYFGTFSGDVSQKGYNG